jgi:hypothetical protein
LNREPVPGSRNFAEMRNERRTVIVIAQATIDGGIDPAGATSAGVLRW